VDEPDLLAQRRQPGDWVPGPALDQVGVDKTERDVVVAVALELRADAGYPLIRGPRQR